MKVFVNTHYPHDTTDIYYQSLNDFITNQVKKECELIAEFNKVNGHEFECRLIVFHGGVETHNIAATSKKEIDAFTTVLCELSQHYF